MATEARHYVDQRTLIVTMVGNFTVKFICRDQVEIDAIMHAIDLADRRRLKLATFKYNNGTQTGAIAFRNVLAIGVWEV
jgi:hypothetical protein